MKCQCCSWKVGSADTATENGQIIEDESIVGEDEQFSQNSAKPVVVLMWILMSILC
jgi:hypothetical protein